MNFYFLIFILFFLAFTSESQAQFAKVFDESVIDNVLFTDDTILTPIHGFTLLDTLGNVIWSKRLVDSISGNYISSLTTNMDINEEGDFLIKSNLYENSINKFVLTLLNKTGNILWSKTFQPDIKGGQLRKEYEPHTFFIGNRIYVFGSYEIEELGRIIFSVIELDTDGNLISNCAFDNLSGNSISYYHLFDSTFAYVNRDLNNDRSQISLYNAENKSFVSFMVDMLVFDIKYRQLDDGIYILGDSGSLRSPKILKLNLNFDILMSKFLILNAFVSGRNFIAYTNEGIFLKTREDSNSDVFSLLTYDGDLLGAWRFPRDNSAFVFPMYGSSKHVLHFAFASTLSDNQPTSFLALHDPKFKDFGCYIPETCVDIEELKVDITPVEETFIQISLDIQIENSGYIVEDNSITSRDFCPDNFTPIAVPLFSSDDTLCVGEIVPLYNLQNVNAESVQWNLPGSNLEFSELSEPIFSYDEPGEYTITQTVEYAGCFSDYEVVVVVVAPEEVVVETEYYICKDEELYLDVEQSFQADYLWLIDSTNLPKRENVIPGLYELEISDRHCVQAFDIQVEDFDYNLIGVSLDYDTSICMQRPVELNAVIDPAANYEWSDGFTDLNRTISESGFYTLTTSQDGCSISSSIQVLAEDCSTQLYLPSAFSPNLDGVNDDFFPLGNYFEVASFRVYDRWGTLVHDNPLDPWNGKFREKESPTGVYTYTLQIKNILLDEVELLKGDVALIR